MVGFMDPYKDVVNKHEPLLCETIVPEEMLPYLKEVLTQRAVETITCEQRNYGASTAVSKLLWELKRKKDWFPALIRALLALGHDDVADKLDPYHKVPRPTSGAAAGPTGQNSPSGTAAGQQVPQGPGPSRQGRTAGQPPADPQVEPFSVVAQDTQPHQRPDHGQVAVVLEEEGGEKKDGGDDRHDKDEEMPSMEGCSINSTEFVRRRMEDDHRAPGRTYADGDVEENPTEGAEHGAIEEQPTAFFEEAEDDHLDGSPQHVQPGALIRELEEENMQKIRIKDALLEEVKSEAQDEADRGRSGTPIPYLMQKEHDARGAEGNRSDGEKDEGGSSGSSFELPPGFEDSMEEHWNLGGDELAPPNNELTSPPHRAESESLQKIDNITRAEKQGKSEKEPPGLGPTNVAFISGAGKRTSAVTVCDGRENELATEPKDVVQPTDNGDGVHDDGMNDYVSKAPLATISGTITSTAPKDTKDAASPTDPKSTDFPTHSKAPTPNKPKAREPASKPSQDNKTRPTDTCPRKPPVTKRPHTVPERTADENNGQNANRDTEQKPSMQKDADGGGVGSWSGWRVAGGVAVAAAGGLAVAGIIRMRFM
ncbi:uncharacterized protein LOC118414576 [Branchiostoma floridae]|uniref:Uncharacterized protein LOC118414576 n=1 Tax=Branchiostoma floridae TaxID=7739 RepID=A0A9J7L1X0_BRAFL|nr:uncharacterized protein LOC118414576 [Branchiostoma floridae]XP_035674607.1 uncharacterized protein LOC118414576 [Branchiostoma floridae]XP_035674608.1 uncharacterized protein LOC118414576 [Branchiostoma floridae]